VSVEIDQLFVDRNRRPAAVRGPAVDNKLIKHLLNGGALVLSLLYPLIPRRLVVESQRSQNVSEAVEGHRRSEYWIPPLFVP